MNKTVRKFRFIDVYHIGETESWLSDMALQGFHLKRIGPVFAHFERSEPEHIRYRIDFTSSLPGNNNAQRALYSESGWEYVCSQYEMHIFRSPEGSDAPELHTDPAEQSYTLEKQKRRFTLIAIMTTLLYAVSNCITIFAMYIGRTPTLKLVEGDISSTPLINLLLLFSVILSIASAHSIRKLVRSLRDGCEINHQADWKRLYLPRVMTMIILIIIAPFVIGLPFAKMMLQHTEELPYENNNQAIIRLADIEDDTALARYEGISALSNRDRYNNNSIEYKWSLYAPVMMKIQEDGVIPGRMYPDGSGEYSPSIECLIYKLRNEKMADPLINDLRRKYEGYSMLPFSEETDKHGFDKLYTRSEQYKLEVLASKSNAVVWLCYYGDKDMQTVIDAVMRTVAGG